MSVARDNIASEIALFDTNEERVKGELSDMKHAVPFFRSHPPHIIGSSDVRITSGSDLVIVASGVRQNEGESRLLLVDRNIAIFETLIPKLVQQSPNAVFIVQYLIIILLMPLILYNTISLDCEQSCRHHGSGRL